MGQPRIWRIGQIALVFLVATAASFWLARREPSTEIPVPQRMSEATSPASTNIFQHFSDWCRNYVDAPSKEKLPEGVALARSRREALRVLIQADPEHALRMGIPYSVRSRLPADMLALVEDRISGRGELSVMATLAPDQAMPTKTVFRIAKVGDKRFQAFVYGRRLGHPTRPATVMRGIAVGNLFAVHDDGVRVLDAEEAAVSAAGEAICGISGLPTSVGAGGVAVEVSGRAQVLCSPDHVAELNQQLAQAEATPSAFALGAGDSPGSSIYTTGEKRVLILRVDFSDLPGEPLAQAAGVALLNELAVYFRDVSYGKMVVPTVGQGSDVTPTFRMPNSASYYGTNNYYDRLRADARRLAEEAGYLKARYEFDVICFGPVPGWIWAGLAYVGGPGAWLRNSFNASVAAHEIGHNLGLNHANFWDTDAQSVIGQGLSSEYGDIFDTMGGGGVRAYNARYRAYLNWITANEIATVSTGGLYRLGAHDLPNAPGVKALKVERHTGTVATNSYWLEFRQKTNATPWQRNGAGLRWAGDGGQSTLLLDVTPGSAAGKDDSSIGVGRTFSDRAFETYITVLRKAPTVPESLDVLVNRGPFPGNASPVMSIESPPANMNVGANITIRATAFDPDNDALAFAWDFGDGTVSTDNSDAVNHAWFAPGEFLVHCVVSDMKGAQASDWRIVRVGLQSEYRISGRVTTQDGLPMESVRVHVSDGQVVYTRSDGRYSVVGLTQGSYNISASSEGWGFSSPGFRNPVTVGPNADNIDFFGGPPSQLQTRVLVGFNATWSYLDDGSNQGTGWTSPNFNDSFWNSGVAEFGYGDGDEATTVRAGTPLRHITTYFRHAFNVTNQVRLTSASLKLLRDDGGVVYLNGREVFRSFMPVGPISYNTLAQFHTEGWAERTRYEAYIEPDLLVLGRNVIAVEIHQASTSSPDMSFDLNLAATELFDSPRGIAIVGPGNNAIFTGPSDIYLRADASAGGAGTIRHVQFFQGNVGIGISTNIPFSIIWSNVPPGLYAMRAVGTDNSGVTLTSAPVNITVQAAPAYVRISNVPQNTIFLAPTNIAITADASPGSFGALTKVEFFVSTNKLGEDATPPYNFVWSNAPPGSHSITAIAIHQSLARMTSSPVNIMVETLRSVRILDRHSPWKYRDLASDPGSSWRNISFDDSSWPMGTAPLGAGDPHIATLINIGPATARYPAICFRRAFNLPAITNYEALVLRLLRDDGAAVYLNGTLAVASGVSVPTVFSQYATQAVDGIMESAYVEYVLSTTNLRVGANVVAVEIKNASPTSDDLGFDLEMEALLDSGAPRLRAIDPPAGLAVEGLRHINVDFDTPVANVNASDLLISGQAATALTTVNSHEFTFTFPQPPLGMVQIAWAPNHGITDRSSHSKPFVGGSWSNRFETSSSQRVLVLGGVWNYLDNGTDPGPLWNTPEFDDLLWRSGVAQLGFGDGDESTRIGFVPTAGGKPISYYFRKSIVITDPGHYDTMRLLCLIDDGAVVYVNGVEATRLRMPPGTPRFDTVADVSGDFTWDTISLSPDLFVAGRNVIAVEVHQGDQMDSDLSFDLQLLAEIDRTAPRVTSVNPISGSVLEELKTIGALFTEDVSGVQAGDLLINGQPATNLVQVSPREYVFRFSPPSTGVVQVAWSPGHGIVDLAGNPLQAGNWSYTISPYSDERTPVAKGAIWKYLDTGVDLGTGWTAPDFDDSEWPSGRAELGYGDGGEATVVGFGPNPSAKYATTYFRRKFVVEEPAVYGNLIAEIVYDDGAIIYLNGVEVRRVRIPADVPIAYDTYIGSGADYVPELFGISRDLLVKGTNIVAVEMHQSDGAGSDLSFDFRLQGNLAPVVTVTRPADTQQFSGPTNIIVNIAQSDPDGEVQAVEFFDRETFIGESTAAPFSFTWSDVPDGNYVLTARARDNFGATRNSSPVLFSVNDPARAGIAGMSVRTNEVRVTFSKRLLEETAVNTSHYAVSDGVAILAVSLSADLKTVILKTSPLISTQTYSLTVQDVVDLSGQPVTLDTPRTFTVEPFQSANLGFGVDGAVIYSGSGYEIEAGGAQGIGNSTDNCFYYWEERDGDFDFQVRVESLGFSDVSAKGGLMVRERLADNSRFAGVFATPSILGCLFQYRTNAAYRAVENGFFPATYPDTWLRLRRHGLTNLTGFASTDGKGWTMLGTARITLPERIYFGFAVSSRSPSQPTTARFMDFGSTAVAGTLPSEREPLGPSTRRGPLVISEIMYHPSVGFTHGGYPDDCEFIEIYNSSSVREDIGSWGISGDAKFTFPAGTTIPPGGFIVVAANPTVLSALYGLSSARVLGPYAGTFRNPLPEGQGGAVQLRNEFGAVICDVHYETTPPWPPEADGAGHSLVLARPSLGERDVRAWAASDQIGGSPGRDDPFPSDPLREVVINEFLAPDYSFGGGFVELYNRSSSQIDLSGCWLTENPQAIGTPLARFRVPDGTYLEPHAFISLAPGSLFGPRDGQRWLYFLNPAQTRVLDVVEFHGQPDGTSGGRYPDGDSRFQTLRASTPAAPNAIPSHPDVIINEIMYHPLSGDSDEEFVELYNTGAADVNVSGWQLGGGINFTFPLNTIIRSGEFLAIARNIARLRVNHPSLHAQNSIGNYDGALSNEGERLVLSRPKQVRDLSGRVISTAFVTVNEVTYGTGGRWGQWSDGGGSSLELIDPRSDNRLAANWADSDESRKSAWSTIEFNGLATNGHPFADHLQLFLQGPGECLLDDVQLFMNLNPSSNFIRDPDFEIESTNWVAGGTHEDSSRQLDEGHNSAASLCVRAARRGDVSVNCVRTRLLGTIANGSSITIRARARWLKGDRFLLLRLRGGGAEAAGDLAVPADLGTPGARNSRFVTNGAPAIYDVKHSPVLPGNSENVVVTCRASDREGLSLLNLVYRVDPTTLTVAVPMRDDGSPVSGDIASGDGFFSATIPGQLAGVLVAFYIEARDPAAVQSRFPNEAPQRECLVRFGDTQPSGSLGAYHIWFTQATGSRWEAREKNSGTELDCTFVYNNYRVIYNAGTLYAGSVWHTPSYRGPLGTIVCDYELHAPPDDRFLNADDMVFAAVGNNNNDPTAVAEQGSYWIARKLGLPWTYRRFIHLFVMGNRRGLVFEDAQQPNQDFLDEYFPDDSHGSLHRVQDWFEFTEDGEGHLGVDAKLTMVTTTNAVKWTPIYREWWRPRANGLKSPNDFSELFALVDAVNLPKAEPYTRRTETLADLDEWMRYLAFQRMVGNWDSYGYRRGNNAYAYKPQTSRWILMPYDVDFDLGVGDSAYYSLFDTGGVEPVIAAMLAHPPFLRKYWRAYRSAIASGGPLNSDLFDPMIDSLSAALAANGVGVAPSTLEKNYVTDRRNYLATQIPQAPFVVNGPSIIPSPVNQATISGTAPIEFKNVLVNGLPVTWTNVTSWIATVVLRSGQNNIVVEARDETGNPIPGASHTLLATFAGPEPDPRQHIVISEIMYEAARPHGGFVELQNRSSTFAFDLSGWRVEGVEYTFPAGFIVYPTQVVAIVEDTASFLRYYGTNGLIAQYPGQLDPDGEVLALIKPGASPNADVIVDKVRYEPRRPWPAAARDGASLQLLDGAEDNSRVSNWSDVHDWKFFSVTGIPTTNLLMFYLTPAGGEIYLDDIYVCAGNVSESGPNLVRNPGFESPFVGSWITNVNTRNTSRQSATVRSGNSALRLNFLVGGGSVNTSFVQTNVPVVTGNVYTVSFWYSFGTNAPTLRVSMSGISPSLNGAMSGRPVFSDGGLPNVAARDLPAYDAIWLNEVQANNGAGPVDNTGEGEPWIELYNGSSNAISLASYYLSDDYGNLGKWSFAPDAVLNPGHRIVWMDGEPQETAAQHLHAGFRLNASTGAVMLSRAISASDLQIVDYINFSNLTVNASYGNVVDGDVTVRQVFYAATPGTTNRSSPISVFINEWMAINHSAFADPWDLHYDDWFELYNAHTFPVDISGYYLSDRATTLANRKLFRIPTGTTVPARGHRVVWADEDPRQVNHNGDLHANFKLNQAFDRIYLHAPDGHTLIDSVLFHEQIADTSQGRYPDGMSISALNRPTPGAPNVGNTAPILQPIGDKTVLAGQTLAFHVSANDAESPPQVLAFTLDSAPVGAAIDFASGLFTWRPALNQTPSTNAVTVRVLDGGDPSLDQTRSFVIRAYPSPRASVSWIDSAVSISFETVAGVSYQVEYAETLLEPVHWRALGLPASGSGNNVTIIDNVSGSPQRFYRIRQLN